MSSPPTAKSRCSTPAATRPRSQSIARPRGEKSTRSRSRPHVQPLPVAIAEAIEQLKESPLERREVYAFTDLAKASWPA